MSYIRTALVIHDLATAQDIPLPLGSDRNLTATIQPIEEATNLQRTINGKLLDLSDPNFAQYRLTVDVQDQILPATFHLRAGKRVRVDSPISIAEPVVGGVRTLTRDFAPGSVMALNAAGIAVPHTVSGKTVSAAGAQVVRYRPRLVCLIESISHDESEGRGDAAYSISFLEEELPS